MNLMPKYSVSPEDLVWEAVISEVQNFDSCVPDWDGCGAEAVPLSVINNAVKLLRFYQQRGEDIPTSVYPIADGTIIVEWRRSETTLTSINVRNETLESVSAERGKQTTFLRERISDFFGLRLDSSGASSTKSDEQKFDDLQFSLAA